MKNNNEFVAFICKYALTSYVACFLFQYYAMHVLKWKKKKRLFVCARYFKPKQNYFHKNSEIKLNCI